MESIAEAAERLSSLCEIIPPLLQQIPEENFAYKSTVSKWSKKEILGHLIDSATNNHQRFIRIQYENNPVIFYDQNAWNELSHYQLHPNSHLISLWKIYNQHLLILIRTISPENLLRTGAGRDGKKYSLQFYIIDYISHLEHHLHQLVTY